MPITSESHEIDIHHQVLHVEGGYFSNSIGSPFCGVLDQFPLVGLVEFSISSNWK